MAMRVNRTVRIVGWIVAATLLAAIAFALGAGLSGNGIVSQTGEFASSGAPEAALQRERKAISDVGQSGAGQDSYSIASEEPQAGAVAGSADEAAGTAAADPMVIRTAALDMQVDKVDTAISGIRTAAKRNGASVEQLAVSGGNGPRPLSGAEAAYPTPANATIVLRVPADKLEALSADIAKLGTVTSQGSSADDVTQQYVDMAARLKNLKTEESRLRSFFSRATKVSDLLAVERELARVRGEIESMQAQVDYLERQVARATLTVNLTEPGPIVQPGGANWGFEDAVRRGVQGAAALITSAITVVIALAPLVVVGLLAWLLVRWALRRRRAHRPLAGRDEDSSGVADDEA